MSHPPRHLHTRQVTSTYVTHTHATSMIATSTHVHHHYVRASPLRTRVTSANARHVYARASPLRMHVKSVMSPRHCDIFAACEAAGGSCWGGLRSAWGSARPASPRPDAHVPVRTSRAVGLWPLTLRPPLRLCCDQVSTSSARGLRPAPLSPQVPCETDGGTTSPLRKRSDPAQAGDVRGQAGAWGGARCVPKVTRSE